MMRAFIAIMPPVALHSSFVEIRSTVERQAFPWRWVQPEQVHVTMKFLGDIEPARIDAIAQAMQQAAFEQTPFTLSGYGLGCFPNPLHPRVLWMGLEDPHQHLTRLHQRLEEQLTALGFAAEAHPFRPHLTLARAPRDAPGRAHLAPLLQTYRERHFGDIVVSQLQLWQSQLRREGALYTLLRSVALIPQDLSATAPEPQG
jgi:2'-5' RNA ligase